MSALVLIGVVVLFLCAACYVIAAWADDTNKPEQGCEFVGSLGDQVFRCRHCDAFPEDCIDGDCCCVRERVR